MSAAQSVNSSSRLCFVSGQFGKRQVLKFEIVVYEISGYKSYCDAVRASAMQCQYFLKKLLLNTNSCAKQTKMLGFGAERGLLQGQGRRMRGSCSKNPSSLMVLEEEFLKAKFGVRAAGCVTFF